MLSYRIFAVEYIFDFILEYEAKTILQKAFTSQSVEEFEQCLQKIRNGK